MGLIRGHHAFDEHFTQIPNDWLRDDRLSLEARGLLAQILSHKPGWSLSIRTLSSSNHIGKEKVRRIIGELMRHGYLERSEKQGKDDQGRMTSYDYITRDPEPRTDLPCTENPPTVDRPTKNTITKNTITKETTFNDVEQVSRYSPDFERFWKNYPRRQQKGDAWKAWEQLRKKKLLPSLDVLTVAAEAYGLRVTDPKFTKLPAGWLRAEMWLDEPQAPKRGEVKDSDYNWNAAQENIRRLKLEGKL